MSGVGDTLNAPGAYARGLLAGEPGKRRGGRELLEKWGLLKKKEEDEGLDSGDAAGFVADILTDPLTYAGGWAAKAGVKALQAARGANTAKTAVQLLAPEIQQTARIGFTPKVLNAEYRILPSEARELLAAQKGMPQKLLEGPQPQRLLEAPTPPFYSRLDKAVEGLPERFKPESFENLLKKAPEGVSGEEMRWRQVPETQKELQDVTKAMGDKRTWRQMADATLRDHIKLRATDVPYNESYQTIPFAQFTHPSGRDYGVTLLHMPENGKDYKPLLESLMKKHEWQANTADVDPRMFAGYLRKRGFKDDADLLLKAYHGSEDLDFTSHHWPQKNVVVHIRHKVHEAPPATRDAVEIGLPPSTAIRHYMSPEENDLYSHLISGNRNPISAGAIRGAAHQRYLDAGIARETSKKTKAMRRGDLDMSHLPPGEKQLVAHEIQSDWAQQGGRAGYRGDLKLPEPEFIETPPDLLKRRRYEVAILGHEDHGYPISIVDEHSHARNYLKMLVDSGVITKEEAAEEDARHLKRIAQGVYQNDNGLGGLLKEAADSIARKRYHVLGRDSAIIEPERFDTLEAAKEHALKLWTDRHGPVHEAMQAGKPPDMPFKDDWERLAIKQLIQQAIDKGHRHVGWLKGKHAAGRATGHEGKPLEQLGEETLSGLLKHYDETLPNIASKYLKRWGAKVENTPDVWHIHITDKMIKDILKKGQPLLSLGALAGAGSLTRGED